MIKITIKKVITIAIAFISVSLSAQDEATYTITGKKDPRLDAWYLASYVSQSYTDECTSKSSFTGGKRYNIGGRSIQVQDGNYTIKLPIRVTGENNDCDYKFNGLELIMTRKYDEKLSSIHPVLSSRKEVNVVYWKTDGGAMSFKHPDTPPYLETTKEYFRIAQESTFLCKTFWFPESRDRTGRVYKEHSQFHCTMQIESDKNRTLYTQKNPSIWTFSHPEFGVDDIVDTTMKIDILVDEKNCRAIKNEKVISDNFRELKEPTFWQKLF